MVTAALSMAQGQRGGMTDAQREGAASMMRPMIRFYPITTAIGFLSTNLAAVLPESTGPVLTAGARTLDALTLVYLMVFVAMLGSYGNPRVSERAMGVVVGVCFVIWVAIRMGWAAAFGS